MPDVIRIVIPGSPKGWGRANSRLVTPKDKAAFTTLYTPTKTRIEAGVVRMYAEQAMNGSPPLDGAVDLRIAAYMPIPRSWSQKKQALALAGAILPTSKPDWTNIARFEDALKSIVWRDDSQVTAAHVWKHYSDKPRVIIEVRSCTISRSG